LLQQPQVAANNASLRDLTADEAKQLERICNALLQCQKQQPVTAALMRRALTTEQFGEYEQQLQAPTNSEAEFDRKNRPFELTKYLSYLKTADLMYARSMRLANSRKKRRIGNMSAAGYWEAQSEYKYESANECLEEELGSADAQQQQLILSWLDRPFDNIDGGNIGCDPASVARVIGSRSKYCQVSLKTQKADKLRKQLDCTASALIAAAQQLIYVPVATDVVQTLQLKTMLGKLKR
jgi:hypothetical protein